MTGTAIFVKTPGLSPVKSRLAAGLGKAAAEECHRRCAKAVAAIACSARIGPVYWAIAEAEGMNHRLWQDLPRLCQPAGGLGARMHQVHEALLERHGRALLLGADLPQLTARALLQAHQWLQDGTKAGVLGPASDGGFWLVGSNCRLPAATWNAPRYGHDQVLREFQEAADPAISWRHLNEQTDLDDSGDLAAVCAALVGLERAHPAQRSLLEWLQSQRTPRIS